MRMLKSRRLTWSGTRPNPAESAVTVIGQQANGPEMLKERGLQVRISRDIRHGETV